MHILPDLHALEKEFSISDGLCVLGVHSAKFDNEKDSANILSAVLRYNITHPVVNDHEAVMWNELGVQCWPTLLLVGPDGKMLFMLMGESHLDVLPLVVGETLKYYKDKGLLSDHDIGLELSVAPPSQLSFPGKIALNRDATKLVVADTGHHRVLVMTTDGSVLVS